MKKNIGTNDRILRASISIILLVIAIYLKNIFVFLAAIFTAYEAVAGWCAFYALIGKNSCPIKKNSE